MRLLEPVSSDHVAACWLQAELSSPRFRPRVVGALRHLRLSPGIVTRPILTNRRENLLRHKVLSLHRGDIWGRLPPDTEWWRGAITRREFQRLRVINYPTWTLLSRNTGRLSAAATVIATHTVPRSATGRWAREARAVITHVHRMRDRVVVGETRTPLILMGHPGRRTWTILEGNKRASAFYIRCFCEKTACFPPSIQVLVGLTARRHSCLRRP